MSERLHRAIDLAARAHARQKRKDSDVEIPYVAHVYGVALMLARLGFPEDVVVAGLLHDVFEDAPEFAPAVKDFGEHVERWVRTVTDPGRHNPAGEAPWDERKEAYIGQIRAAEPEAKAIACADKIHNMESLVLSMRRGQRPHFRHGREAQLRYWRRVREAFGDWQHPMIARYEELLQQLNDAS